MAGAGTTGTRETTWDEPAALDQEIRLTPDDLYLLLGRANAEIAALRSQLMRQTSALRELRRKLQEHDEPTPGPERVPG